MGLLDKAKEKASHLAEQAKDKIGEVKERRKADDLLDDLGKILYRQRTERGEPGDDAEIDRIVGELRALEADGAEIVPPPPAAADTSQPSAPATTPTPPASAEAPPASSDGPPPTTPADPAPASADGPSPADSGPIHGADPAAEA
jgi:hypothetical protein